MEKKVINEEQFKKLVIKEAKSIFSEESKKQTTSTSRFSFDKVEALINEISVMNKSITSISFDAKPIKIEDSKTIEESKIVKRDVDMNEYNDNKNVVHINEGEKAKWDRMLRYRIPKDSER